MNTPLPITGRLVLPAASMRIATSRSGGPGGQHVNTADTRVQLWFDLAGCSVLRPEVKQRIAEANSGHPKRNSEG